MNQSLDLNLDDQRHNEEARSRIMDGVHVVEALDELDRPGDGDIGDAREEVTSPLDALDRFKERGRPEKPRRRRCSECERLKGLWHPRDPRRSQLQTLG